MVLIISALISLTLMYAAGSYFYSVWIESSKINELFSMIGIDSRISLLIITIVFCVIAYEALFFFVNTLCNYFWNTTPLIFDEIRKNHQSINLCSILKKIAFIVSNVLVSIIIGTLLLVGVYRMPIENIEKNVKCSAEIMEQEGLMPSLFSWCTSQLDNFTDSIILANAGENVNEDVVNKAMFVYRGVIDEINPQTSLVQHYCYDTDYISTNAYPRYWHGYLIVIKPLLDIMNLSEIRVLNFIIQFVLTLTICILLNRRNLKAFIIPYMLAYLMLCPAAMAKSMQFSSCFYAFSIGTIVLLFIPDNIRSKYSYLVFLNIGIFTAYFDLLTYPIATFGVPSAIYLVLQNKDNVRKKLIDMIGNGIAWCIGYGCMWASKWLVLYILTGNNILSDVGNEFGIWSTIGNNQISIVSRIIIVGRNYVKFFTTPFVIIPVMALYYSIIKSKKQLNYDDEKIKFIVFPFILLSFSPIVWYSFAINHSSIHSLFTNKACIVPFLSILFSIVCIKNECINETKITK